MCTWMGRHRASESAVVLFRARFGLFSCPSEHFRSFKSHIVRFLSKFVVQNSSYLKICIKSYKFEQFWTSTCPHHMNGGSIEVFYPKKGTNRLNIGRHQKKAIHMPALLVRSLHRIQTGTLDANDGTILFFYIVEFLNTTFLNAPLQFERSNTFLNQSQRRWHCSDVVRHLKYACLLPSTLRSYLNRAAWLCSSKILPLCKLFMENSLWKGIAIFDTLVSGRRCSVLFLDSAILSPNIAHFGDVGTGSLPVVQ